MGQTLINNSSIYVGNSAMTVADTLTAKALTNTGTLTLDGASATAAGSMSIASAAGFGVAGHLTGTVSLSGYSAIAFASGSISNIDSGAWLALSGAHAFIENATLNANSALAGLSAIAGSLYVNGGAKIAAAAALQVSGLLSVDSYTNYTYAGSGGSTVSVAGALTTASGGNVDLGSSNLTSTVALSAASLKNAGTLNVSGGSSAATAAKLTVASAAGFGVAGQLAGTVDLSGDATIAFVSGQITSIASGATLNLSGASAGITEGGAASALQGLATNSGNLYLSDAALKTTGALVNNSYIEVDTDYGNGGSSLTIGGLLTNSGNMSIGSYGLAQDDVVTAGSLLNSSKAYISLSGNPNHFNATLAVAGAITNNGYFDLYNDTETLAGAVGGNGSFSLDNSSLDFGASVGSGENLNLSGLDTLTLGHADLFAASISGFGADDTIVASNFGTGTTSSFADDILTLTSGATSAHIHFSGAYVAADFAVTASSTGTTVKFV